MEPRFKKGMDMMQRRVWLTGAAAVAVLAGALVAQDKKKEGYTDTPVITGQKWKVHDADRPAPTVVTPGREYGLPPSDAIILFDGKDLSKWQGGKGEAPWKVENGYIECAPKTGDIQTKDKWGDFQLHIEWASPAEVKGNSQGRGNSGVFLHGRYEIQVLDSFENPTYADGGASAIYGQWPPLVNAARKPGEWQTYDIVFHAAKFKDGALESPATATVFHNGVLTHEKKDILGPTQHRNLAKESAYDGKGGIRLQDHGNTTRFRNIWIRPVKGYDEP
jgi:hypothetical protein